jgi:uncharacterized protein (TIGR00251 family)
MPPARGETPTSVLAVRVTPRSSRPGIVTWEEGVLRVNVSAPPVGGRANRELVGVIAKGLGVARSCVEILSGGSGRKKRLRIVGMSQESLEAVAARFRREEG